MIGAGIRYHVHNMQIYVVFYNHCLTNYGQSFGQIKRFLTYRLLSITMLLKSFLDILYSGHKDDYVI